MINEIESLFGIFLLLLVNYFWIHRYSKVISGVTITIIGLISLITYQGTDHEIISWAMILIGVISAILVLGQGKWGATKS